MANYKATIIESSKELTARERLKVKDFTAGLSIDRMTEDIQGTSDTVLIRPDAYALVEVENDKATPPMYQKLVIIDEKENVCLHTGSESFIKAFLEIWNEMTLDGEKDWLISAFRVESKNYTGRDFLSCTIV